MKNIVLLIALMSFSALSSAGTGNGKIAMIQAGHGYSTENVYFLITIDGVRVKSGCAANDPRMAINPATEAGKVMLSMLLAAKAAGQTVEVHGTSECGLMGDIESISYLRVL